MATKIQVNRLTNANCYLDGVSLLGRVEEATLPDVTTTLSEHKGLGLVGTFELPSGIDKLDAKLTFNSLYPEVARRAGNPFRAVPLQLRASLDTYESAGRTRQVPVVWFLTGTFKKFPLGGFKQNEAVTFETELNVTYCKLVYAGLDLLELDVLANIYRVGGEDLLATYRRNIGG